VLLVCVFHAAGNPLLPGQSAQVLQAALPASSEDLPEPSEPEPKVQVQEQAGQAVGQLAELPDELPEQLPSAVEPA
jgi:hypothetical protein